VGSGAAAANGRKHVDNTAMPVVRVRIKVSDWVLLTEWVHE
jgi:hypothetical protein